jgi:hypothetical protein
MTRLKYLLPMAALLIIGATRLSRSQTTGLEMLASCEHALREIQYLQGNEVTMAAQPCWFFFEAVLGLITIGDQTGNSMLRVCVPPKVTLIQHVRIFVAYAQQNPANLQTHASRVAMEALWKTYPCN